MKSSTTSRKALGALASLAMAALDGGNDGWKVVQGADFDIDGKTDVLWNDPQANRFSVWLMEGTRLRAPGPILAGPPGDGWSATTAGDFNGDGMADVLWENTKRNRFAVWLMRGPTVLACGPEIPGPVGDGWTLVPSVSDFNLDGGADVVYQQSKTNLFSVWLMNGTTVLARGPTMHGPAGDGWSVITTADFNRDGMGDTVWTNKQSNLMAIWLMNSAALLAPGPSIPGPVGGGFDCVTSAGDVNFDGTADIVWTNETHSQVTVWLMNSTSLLAPGPLVKGPAEGGWSVSTDGDFDGDGILDLVWEAKNPPRMAVWLMRATSVAATGPVIPGPGAP